MQRLIKLVGGKPKTNRVLGIQAIKSLLFYQLHTWYLIQKELIGTQQWHSKLHMSTHIMDCSTINNISKYDVIMTKTQRLLQHYGPDPAHIHTQPTGVWK